MKAVFKSGRIFNCNHKWYVYMRERDEYYKSFCGLKKIIISVHNGRRIAGPFRTKKILLYWLESFISTNSQNRISTIELIPDRLYMLDKTVYI